MSGFPSFVEGALTREIANRGLSRAAFAEKAGINADTITRADRGDRLKPKTFGKILIALGAIPVVDMPDLVRTA